MDPLLPDLLAALRAALRQAVPALADLPLRPLPVQGTEARILRLGADHLLRLPLVPGAPSGFAVMAHWLPWLAARLPLRLPRVIASGDRPLPWLLLDRIPGRVADPEAGSGETALARDLAAFVAALRSLPMPDDAPVGQRGGPLAPQDAAFRTALARVAAEGLADAEAARAIWDEGCAAPRHSGAPVWLHGDLMAGNLLLRRGSLAAVIDWAGLTNGDPAYDLTPAWFVFGPAGRAVFLSDLSASPDQIARARARVAWQCVLALPAYAEGPMAHAARRGLAALAGP